MDELVMADQPIDIAMRISDRLTTKVNTIEVHRRMIEQQGAVWFGVSQSNPLNLSASAIVKNPVPVLLVHSRS